MRSFEPGSQVWIPALNSDSCSELVAKGGEKDNRGTNSPGCIPQASVGSWSASPARFAGAVIPARADGPELDKVMVLQETCVGTKSSSSDQIHPPLFKVRK